MSNLTVNGKLSCTGGGVFTNNVSAPNIDTINQMEVLIATTSANTERWHLYNLTSSYLDYTYIVIVCYFDSGAVSTSGLMPTSIIDGITGFHITTTQDYAIYDFNRNKNQVYYNSSSGNLDHFVIYGIRR